ncbi:hypothetical protein KCU95_g34, partial [Aureobasidium melanogenum]
MQAHESAGVPIVDGSATMRWLTEKAILVKISNESFCLVAFRKVYEEASGFPKHRWKRRSCEDAESNNQDVDAPIGHIKSLWNLTDFVNQRHKSLMVSLDCGKKPHAFCNQDGVSTNDHCVTKQQGLENVKDRSSSKTFRRLEFVQYGLPHHNKR